MIVRGTVNQVRRLEADSEKYDDAIYSVSVEGFSILARPGDIQIPKRGSLISANVEVHWRKGQRPIHWLRAISIQDGLGSFE